MDDRARGRRLRRAVPRRLGQALITHAGELLRRAISAVLGWRYLDVPFEALAQS